MIRKVIGWGIAQWFILSGARKRKLKEYDNKNTVLSLVGHDPTPEELEKILQWLIDHGFTFVSTDQLLNKNLPKGRKAWLTFDDGWTSFKSFLPIFAKLRVPVTLFVAPHETERGQIWTNSIMSAVSMERIRGIYKMPLCEREKIVDEILAKIGNPRKLLTKEELVELAKSEWVTLENHTWSHLSCSHRPVADVVEEIKKANEILQEWTGRKCRLVCFPFGQYREGSYNAVLEMGLHPVTCEAGLMTIDKVGEYRNMFRENVSFSENICRCLNSWLKVVTPDK